MLKLIGIVIAVLILALLITAATRPDHFRVERMATIEAPPEKIYPLIEDFHRWPAWSPYEKLDPAMKRTISGPASGKGAVYEWSGNSKAGQGRMEIVAAEPSTHVGIQLDFIKPIKAHNMADFNLQPQADGTRVTWVMNGRNTFLGKVMSLFFDVDKMVGKDFEAGLANMKTVAER
ncbi:MAG TPA: SRPBCC family protein [Steroidobacteraceae bacterium]|nr:SRPBCC family protein [Steroidobacteraceae bacterium]